MQISPGSPSGTSLPASSRDFGRRQRQPDRPAVFGRRDRIAGRDRRRFGQPVAFDDRRMSLFIPALRDAFLDRHPAAVRDHELRQIQLAEVGMIQQRVVQRVDGRNRRDLIALQLLDHSADIARIRNQHAHAAGAHRQKAADGQRKHVIERQRDNRHELFHVGILVVCRLMPRAGLQHVRHDVPVQQRRALCDAGRAARVLQECDVVGAELRRLERLPRSFGERRIEARKGRQLPGRHHLLYVAHDVVDDPALDAEQIAHRRDDDMLDRRIRNHRLQRRREILENDDRFGTTVLQLMLELTRRVKRVHVDDRIAGAQHRRNRHRILEHVRHHDRNARAAGEAARLQPRAEAARQRIEFAVRDRLAHADERRTVAVLREALVEEVGNGWIRRRVDFGWNAGRVRFQPNFFHTARLLTDFRMVVLKRIVAGRPSRDNRVRRPLRTGDDARPTRVRPFGQAGSTSTRQS